MRDDERPLLREHLVLFGSEPLQQLSPHHQEDGAQESAAEVQSGVVLLQALAEDRDVAEANPSGERRGGEKRGGERRGGERRAGRKRGKEEREREEEEEKERGGGGEREEGEEERGEE